MLGLTQRDGCNRSWKVSQHGGIWANPGLIRENFTRPLSLNILSWKFRFSIGRHLTDHSPA